MGYIIENSVTLEALRKQLKMLQSRVKVLYGTKLKILTLPDLTRDMVCFIYKSNRSLFRTKSRGQSTIRD